ncbi:prolyl oligopeptidase family serine peptidase [Pseudomonas sp. CGJS7]|uniref:carboxylesterase family protein n=1 Tax=Pseudomonas sp. CGJS7 TaxID=3109348 RepID=UPI00300AC767
MPGRPLHALFATLLLASIATLSACAGTPTASAPSSAAMTDSRQHGRFLERELTAADGARHRYQVFVPARSAGGEHPPVVLFLHGSGERGDDNRRQLAVGLAPHIRTIPDQFPAIAVFPQSPADASWTGDTARMALAALDAATREFAGDPKRIALTGLSRGGYGVYELALMQPGRFAALVPVCGGITAPAAIGDLYVRDVKPGGDAFDDAAARLKHTPVWIFHGDRDDAVPVTQSRDMAAALKRAGARDARYTEFAGVGHDSWDRAYATPELWSWVFAQRL